jgi:hypothetical protein
MNEEVPTIRDCFAMFALMGLIQQNELLINDVAKVAYTYADVMLKARNAEPEIGIKTVRKARNNVKNNINS